MAYGKIKADAIIYDDSGSDVEKTIASLASAASTASPTFTGTVTIPTPSSGDNSTKAASTAFVVAGFTGKPASAGTVGASEVVQVDANKDITGFRNVTLSGDLTVNGTTTTIDSTTLTVEDKNIELGKVDTPTDITADGGGITLKGATDKEIKWINATDSWTFNQNVTVTTGALTVQGIEGGAATLFLVADEADDNADYWRIQNVAADNTLVFANYTTGGYTTTLKLNPNGALEDSKGNVRSIPSNAQSSAHVATAADAGKAIHISSGGVTINNSVFSAGDAVTIINNSGSDQTITQGSGFTLHNSADASSGNRTLAGRGMATIWFGAANYGYISGAGLS